MLSEAKHLWLSISMERGGVSEILRYAQNDRTNSVNDAKHDMIFKQLASCCTESHSETFAAGAVCDSVRIRDFEAALLQIFAVIEHGAANE
jgi:hypothetical protein